MKEGARWELVERLFEGTRLWWMKEGVRWGLVERQLPNAMFEWMDGFNGCAAFSVVCPMLLFSWVTL
jgi:hypothetical protein